MRSRNPKRLSRLASPAAALALLLATAAAQAAEPPAYDVETGCRSASARVGGAVVDPDVCISSERRAEQQLRDQWSQFTAADRGTCVPLTRTGGMPTYTELLTCLEMSREVRRLRAQNDNKDGLTTGLKPGAETTGSGAASPRGSSGTVTPDSGRPASPGASGPGSPGGSGPGGSMGGGSTGGGSGGGS